MFYAVCYDVTEDAQRDKAAKVLLRYGQRVQYSVYEIRVKSQAELDELCAKLQQVAPDEKRFRLYRLCDTCRHNSQDLQGQAIINMPAVIIV